MRVGTNRRAARAVLALLVGLLAGAWAGGGLMYVFNRTKLREAAGDVAPVSLPPADEFALVPADAAGFVHVRAADLWKTSAMEDYRKLVGKAGADALKALDDGFVPAPSTLDRVTAVAIARSERRGAPPPARGVPGVKGGFAPPQVPPPPADDSPELDTALVVTFTAPFDAAKVRAAHVPNGEKQNIGGYEVWADPNGGVVGFHGDRTLVLGTKTGVTALLSRPKTPEGPLAPALKLAAGGTRHVVGAVNLKAYRPLDVTRTLPPETSTLLRADALTAGVVVGRGIRLDLRAAYKDADAAEAAEKDLRKSAEAGRKTLAEKKKQLLEAVTGRPGAQPRPADQLPEAVTGLFALGALTMLDEWLENPALERAGPELSAAVTVDSLAGAYGTMTAVGAGLMLPAMEKVRAAAGRAQDGNNLRQLAIGMHGYHDANFRLPAAGLTNPPNAPRGRPLLSWRVAILPYVGEQQLYAQFKLDEPWDSEHNHKLLTPMPRVFAGPRSSPADVKTHYQVFTTPDAARVRSMFGRSVGRRLTDAQDGTSNTIMIVEATEAVEWTKPQDLPFDPDADPPPLGLPGAGGFNAALGDASVRFFPATIRPEALSIWVGANDGIPNPRE